MSRKLSRLVLLFAVSAIAAVITPGMAEAGKGKLVDVHFSGLTSASSTGYSDLEFEGLRGKGGKKARYKGVNHYVFASTAKCSGVHTDQVDPASQWVPGYSSGEFGGSAKSVKVLRVHKGRFSDHGVYNGTYAGIPKQIEYTITGRFTGRTTATGTLAVNVLFTFADGGATCTTGPLTWSACAVDETKFERPACAGIDYGNNF